MKSPVRFEKLRERRPHPPDLSLSREFRPLQLAAGKHQRQRISEAHWGKGQTSESLMPYPVFY